MRSIPTFSLSEDGIPCIGLGTYNRSEEELLGILNQCPIRPLLIDTAARYKNEEAVGSALRESGLHRDDVFLVGKLARAQLSFLSVRQAMEHSLQKLGVYSFDLYLIHSPNCPHYSRVWQELIELRRDGLTRHIGVSGFSTRQMTELYQATGIWPEANQIVAADGLDDTWLTFCHAHHIRVMAAAPFGSSPYGAQLSAAMRGQILWEFYRRGIVSVVGTRSQKHFLENCFSLLSYPSK